ncbi:MAG: hypothetical protein JW925_10820 [Syntrophaceae bacterium]|nr:hypothetical protein [Syntrophaceae bacterium]
MKKPGVIVLGGHVQGLGILRIFGREGIPGILIDDTALNLGRHSKYCLKFFKISEKDLLKKLYQLGEDGQYKEWLIFPTNDFYVKLLSQNKKQLEKQFIVSTDDWESVRLFYNKRETYQFAKKLSIPIAATFYPKNETDLDKIQIEYPCIIKPAIMYDFYRQVKKKVFVCGSIEELKTNYRKALGLIPAEEILVQEIIKGPSKNQFSACFLFLNGQSYVHLTACRMRQHPIDFGNATTYAETVDVPVLKEYGERLLAAANYNGICEVEFKLDERDNQYKFLEVNARTWKWHTIANKAKTPFLTLLYDHLTGNEIHKKGGFSSASYIHFLTDFPVRIKLFLKGYAFWNRKISPIECAVWAADDMKPWFFEKLYLPFYLIKR